MKTLKLKKPDAPSSAAPIPVTPAAPSQEGIFISSRHQNPFEAQTPIKRDNWGWAAALGIISTILILMLIAVEYMDFASLSQA